jgi:hypothetical protein
MFRRYSLNASVTLHDFMKNSTSFGFNKVRRYCREYEKGVVKCILTQPLLFWKIRGIGWDCRGKILGYFVISKIFNKFARF